MPNLHELSAEQILDQIEKRSTALLDAEMRVAAQESDFKSWESLTALALKDSGECKSMTEAERRVQSKDDWCARYLELQQRRAKAAEAKRVYQRAIIAQDLWRTERASMRAAS